MPDVSAKIKGLNVEFNDNLTTSPNIDSGDDIKTSFARIHKRFSDMKTGAYEDIADQYYPSGEGSEKLVTGEIVQSAIESVSGDIEHIEYALKNLSKEIYNDVEMPITTGYYISGITEGDDWTQHLDADSSSQYLENAFYLGARQINKKLKFTVADHRSTSGRCFGFCDENNIVTSYYKESWDIWEQNQDGTYTATLPISGPYFFLSYSELEIIGFEISEELINQTGYVSPNGSDTNGGSTMDFAFKTVSKALSEGCTRIILDGGSYYQRIDLSLAHGKHIDIISYDRAYRPVFYDPDCILTDSAILSDGVYSATISKSISNNNIWIYQDGTPDIETQISEAERLPVQRGKNCRLEDTRIEKCYADNLTDALAEIKSSSIYKWYLDSNTLYFTSPTEPSQSNPICFGTGNDLFNGADRSISIRLSGIKCKYMSLNLKNLCDAEAIDCCSTNVFGWGAITWDNTLNAYFLRCEASSCSNGTNGDGFNADVTNTGEPFAKHYTATLIDCWSHDNTDDGYSDHRHAETTIIGGLFEYNGKAGLTPSNGAHCSCYNVYSRKNYTGFMCTGDVEEAEGGKFTQMICYNCVAELNNRAGNETGFYVDGTNNRMTLISCKAIGNPTAYYVGETASIKLVDCTAFDNNRFIHGYPENATVENTGLYRYIPQSSDLNDFKGNINVGNYLCPTSRATTILNKPTDITTAFKMDVYNYNDQTMQIIYPNDDLCLFYVRLYNGTTWSSWKESATAMQILSYGNSTWNDFITVYNKNAVVYCRASSNSNPATGSQTRMAFMAYVNNGSDPTEVEFQYYRSVSSHTDSQQGDQVYVYKLNKTKGWSVTARNAFSKINVSTPITKSYASQQITLGHADSGVTAGTYNSVTVDAMGHVTGGSNPTTLSGYGITDANINNGTITLGSNTITPITSFSSLDSPLVGGSGKYISSISETDGIISATETTLDTVPTENSTNAITSGAVYTDSANQQLEIDYAINTGVKNLLKFTSTTQTINGVTFTVNDDQTITVNGTASATTTYALVPNAQAILIPDGNYILSGCPNGGGTTTYDLRWYLYSTGKSAYDMGSGASVEKNGNTTSSNIAIIIRSGVTANNLVFKPMIRPAEITDATFEPYAKTNVDLTNENANQQLEINYAINSGSKNLLEYNGYGTGAENGVTYTINADSTITVNGTPQGTAPSYIELKLNGNAANASRFCDGNHILSGCPAGGSDSTYRMYAARSTYSRFDYGEGVLLTNTTLTDVRLVIYISNGYTANNLVFKPMIRSAEITDSTYVPYAPTNRELYETKTNQSETNVIANLGAKNLFPNTAVSKTIGGVTFTVHDDGTVTVNGTKTNNDWFILSENNSFDAGTYTLSDGLPNDTTGCQLFVATARSMSAAIMGTETNRRTHTKTFTTSQTGLYYAIRIASGTTVNNLTFKPMIRHAEITDSTYEPYAPTNRELYETKTEQTETNVIANLGAKNMLYISNAPGYTATNHGRTFTVLSDGGIKITGASSDSSNADFYIIGSWSNRSILLNENKDSCLICMKCDTDYGYNQIRLRAMNRSTGATVNETGVETNKDVRLSHVITTVFISVFPSVTLPEDGIIVYPMIRRAEITDSTFEPYAPTNRELYETMQKQSLRYEDSSIIRLNQLSWSQTSSGAGMWIADCYTTQSIDTIVNVVITSFSQLKPTEITTLFTYIPSSVSGMHTVRLICDRDLTGLSSNPTLYLRVFGYGYQTASTRMLSFNSPMTLNLNRNELDTNFDLLDSIPEEEEGEEDV